MELNAQELEEVNGGLWGAVALVVLAAVLTDWDGFKKGVVDGFNSVTYN
ncbi:MAG: class IIb bacteriocin, lactobin A/cerein 7B family [Bacteroidia bacterium]|nr:class IIb bacteriocin, lactobin A/cerein 7B family [Bacteroidia bacterium]